MATCAIDCAIRRNSCARQAICATPKKKMIGNSAAAPSPIMTAAGEWSGPSAALKSDEIGPGQGEAADNPGGGKHGGDEIGGARPGGAAARAGSGRSTADRHWRREDRCGSAVAARPRRRYRRDRRGLERGGASCRPVSSGASASGRGMPSGRLAACVLVIPDIEGFLDRRQRRFRRIHQLFRVVGHVGRRLACYAGLGRPEKTPAAPRARDRLDSHRAPGFPALTS